MSEFTFPFDPKTEPEIKDECERLAPVLTAFFDGETDTEESRIARKHLLSCGRCAVSWHSWEHTRYLYQAIPVPPVPVGLLVRVLLACRLSALPRRRKRPAEVAESMHATMLNVHDLEMLEAQQVAAMGVSDMAPPSSVCDAFVYDLPAVPVPPHLKDEILRRTVGASAAAASVKAASIKMVDVSLPTESAASSRWSLNWNLMPLPRVNRYASALAVPAMVAWLMMSAQAPFSTQPMAPSTSQPEVETHQTGMETPAKTAIQNNKPIAASAASRRIANLLMQPSKPVMAENTKKEDAAKAVTKTPAPVTAQPESEATTESPQIAMSTLPVASQAQTVGQTQEQKAPTRIALASLSAADKPPTPVASAVSAPVRMAGITKANLPQSGNVAKVLRSRIGAPKLTALPVATLASMKWNSSEHEVAEGSRVHSDGKPKMKMSDVDADDYVVITEEPEDVSTMRQVIDDYRAALVTDEAEEDYSDEGAES